jgi:hypothetical protein
MNAEIKKLWVEDLRQNPELQGTGYLRSGNKFCCLGRLCELFKRETGKGEWLKSGRFAVGDDSDKKILVPPVIVWAGMNSINPAVTDPNTKSGDNLAALNDSGRYTFLQLADLIEEQL